MIIDFHTHIFPPEVSDERDRFLQTDPTFREMYSSPRARVATAEELLAEMDSAGVHAAIALGFAWQAGDLCRRHNDYILEAAAASKGRIIPFCTLNPALGEPALREAERCARAGARGAGELRPENQGYELDGAGGEVLLHAAKELGLLLLFHVSEPVGHQYPGKQGLRLDAFYRFVTANPGLPIVGAHLAGGLPFYAHMTSVGPAVADLFFDTAGVPFLYGEAAYGQVIEQTVPERVLFGSDFPLIGVNRQLEAIRRNVTEPRTQALVLGGNAARLLGYGESA
ncbi:MAG TPA: amidohydrolase family protein [Dehalococcoidia bacterium]|nr:amidohydrolase family protein [Dehalococcoidia bacterium]